MIARVAWGAVVAILLAIGIASAVNRGLAVSSEDPSSIERQQIEFVAAVTGLQPGSLAKVASCVAEHNGNIEEVRHLRAFTHLAVQNAELELILKTRNRGHAQEIVRALQGCGFTARAPE